MPHINRGLRCRRKDLGEGKSPETAAHRAQLDAECIGAKQAVQWLPGRLTERLENGALDETDPQIGQERGDLTSGCPAALLIVEIPPEVEEIRRGCGCVLTNTEGVLDHCQHLGHIAFEAGVRIFGEPFGC